MFKVSLAISLPISPLLPLRSNCSMARSISYLLMYVNREGYQQYLHAVPMFFLIFVSMPLIAWIVQVIHYIGCRQFPVFLIHTMLLDHVSFVTKNWSCPLLPSAGSILLSLYSAFISLIKHDSLPLLLIVPQQLC